MSKTTSQLFEVKDPQPKIELEKKLREKRNKRYQSKTTRITFKNDVHEEFRVFKKRSGIQDNNIVLKYLLWSQRIAQEDGLD